MEQGKRFYPGYVETVNNVTRCNDKDALIASLQELYGVPDNVDTVHGLKQELYRQLEKEWAIPPEAYRFYPDAECFLRNVQ